MPSPIKTSPPSSPLSSTVTAPNRAAALAPAGGATIRPASALSSLARPPALRLDTGSSRPPQGMRPTLSLQTGGPSAARPSLSLRTGGAAAAPVAERPTGQRFGLADPIPATARPLQANDFLGRRADNQLPALMMQATQRGPVLSVANSAAILAAFGAGPHRVAVADVSQPHLAGVQDILNLARQAATQGQWLAAVKSRHGAIGDHLEASLARADAHASFERFKERVETGQVDLFHVDLASDHAAKLRDVAGKAGFAAVYASNIEMYVAGFLNHGETSASDRQQGLEKYRGNLLGLMQEDADFVRGTAMGPMEHSTMAQAQSDWHPQAS